jgi:hypothetical protein
MYEGRGVVENKDYFRLVPHWSNWNNVICVISPQNQSMTMDSWSLFAMKRWTSLISQINLATDPPQRYLAWIWVVFTTLDHACTYALSVYNIRWIYVAYALWVNCDTCMHVCVCRYVCVCVGMHVCAYSVCVRAYALWVYCDTCMHVCVCKYIFIYIYIGMHVCMYSVCLCVFMLIQSHAELVSFSYVCERACTCMCVWYGIRSSPLHRWHTKH